MKKKKRSRMNLKPNKNQRNKKNQRFKKPSSSSLHKKRRCQLNKLLLVKLRRKQRLQKFKRHKKLRLHNHVS